MKLNACGKINLYLKILGKEGKLHTLDMLNASLSLFDRVEITKSDKLSVYCDDKSIKEEDNIAYRAAIAFAERFGTKAVEVKIQKGIPKNGGLGGSSADGAAVIFAMSKIYGVNLTEEDLKYFAVNTSSDLPYMIEGGFARVRGLGEKKEKIAANCNFKGIIVKSEYTASTKDVYAEYDKIPQSPKENNCGRIIKLLEKGDKRAVDLFENDLFLPANKLLPDLLQIQKDLEKLKPDKILLSGSGGCVAAIFNGEIPDIIKLQQKYKTVLPFTTVSSGIEIIEE